jgi:parvulin-like peptidyl-prolyl isomerase
VADPIPGSSGYFILKLVDRQEGQPFTFEEVQDRLRTMLTDQKIEKELEKFLDGLREKFYIEIKA